MLGRTTRTPWAFVLLALSAALIAGVVQWRADSPEGRVLELATDQLGSFAYRLDFRERAIGTYRTRARLDEDRLVLETELQASLPGADPMRVTEQLTFANQAPFALLDAQRRASSGAGQTEVLIERFEDGYRTETIRDGQRHGEPADWNYTLSDHLSIELWLVGQQPEIGATREGRQLDFDRLAPTISLWQLVEREADETVLRLTTGSRGVPEDKIFRLDQRLVPTALSIAGVFTLTRLDDPNAEVLPGPVANSSQAKVALKESIPAPNELDELYLEINAAAARSLPFQIGTGRKDELIRHPRGWELRLRRGPSRGITDQHRGEASDSRIELPADDPRIRALAQRAAGWTDDPSRRIDNMTRFVHGYLSYQSDIEVTGVLDAIALRSGDCTEFADLLTTLARSLGFRANTVTGLAYSEADGPGFYLHAWTEIAEGGHWRAVDPTFGQTELGPSHIRFPDSDTGYLRAYAAIPDMRFRVIDRIYRLPPGRERGNRYHSPGAAPGQ